MDWPERILRQIQAEEGEITSITKECIEVEFRDIPDHLLSKRNPLFEWSGEFRLRIWKSLEIRDQFRKDTQDGF